jgi:hypothetical protein
MPKHARSAGSAPTMRALIHRRAGPPCKVVGCKRPRDPLRAASFCPHHGYRRRCYGHELGRKIPRRDYRETRKWVAELFASNPEHQGVVNATAWIKGWMDKAMAGDKSVPAYVHVARLHRHDVAPLAVLIAVCSVWLHIHLRRLPDDERATFALAVAMLGLAPRDVAKSYTYHYGPESRYREYGANDRKAVGDHIRLHLGPLFVNLVRTLDHEGQAERDAKASLSAPFTTTPKKETQQ